jgi:hypothetical protein
MTTKRQKDKERKNTNINTERKYWFKTITNYCNLKRSTLYRKEKKNKEKAQT